MKVLLTHRHYGMHELVSEAAVPGEFSAYATATPGVRDEWAVDEGKLLAALPGKFLPVPPRRILLGVSDGDGGGTAIDGITVFRPWAKYFDAYMLWLVGGEDVAP